MPINGDPTGVLAFLCARGDIGESDYVRLRATWCSGNQAGECPAKPPGCAIDEHEYWSLRFVRDLARALFGSESVDEADDLLQEYEQALIVDLRHTLAGNG